MLIGKIIRRADRGQARASSRHDLPEWCFSPHPLEGKGAGKAGRRLAPV